MTKFATVVLISLIGSICLQSASAHMANPQKFRIYDENGDDLGLFHMKGGDINSWIEDEDGYSVCYLEGGSETRHRHLSKERAESVRSGVIDGTVTAPSIEHYYYCRFHEDGTIGPNLHFPVASTNPNEVSDHLLSAHIHMTLEKAAELCGVHCQLSVEYHGSIPTDPDRRRKLGGRRRRRLSNYAPSKGTVPNLVIPFKFADHASRTLPSTEELDIMLNSMEVNEEFAPTGGVRKYYDEIS